MQISGAFHRVDARQTLKHSSSAAPIVNATPTAPEPAKRKAPEWPQPVRRYVQRCFMSENYIASINRQEMEQKLKQIITHANEANALGTTDWDNLPLPQQLIQDEGRAQTVKAPPTAMPWQQTAALMGHPANKITDDEFPPLSKKRKSSDLTHDSPFADEDAHKTAPWRKANKRGLNLEDRITFPTRATEPSSPSKYQKHHNGNLEKRQKRFENGNENGISRNFPHPWATARESPPAEASPGPIVGTCQILEKKYLRLTAAPDPSLVRPLHILHRALDYVRKKWAVEQNYNYVCDQFKSMRQDLTVQHIKNDFTVLVYEVHARIALQKNDLGEYNQCQTQLRALYAQNLGGHPMEFKAYRILYFIHTCNRTDMNDVLADLTPAEKEDHSIKHALEVRSAVALNNYHKFFRLYLNTPGMGAYLMDMFVLRQRLMALTMMARVYKPAVSLRYITEELGYESDQQCFNSLVLEILDGDTSFIEDRSEQSDSYTDIYVLLGKALTILEQAKSVAFGKVDIKGQI